MVADIMEGLGEGQDRKASLSLIYFYLLFWIQSRL